MRVAAALLVLVLMGAASAQDQADAAEEEETIGESSTAPESPSIALLVHHPYPDASDPLGIEYMDTGMDAYYYRYQHLDQDGVPGFDFPHTVFDGVVAIEGIPEGDGPYVATQTSYQAAYSSRAEEESPLTMSVFHTRGWNDPTMRDVVVRINTTTDLSGEDLTVWAALVEDPVHFEPPPALSNGVFVHPFAVRAIAPIGPIDMWDDNTSQYVSFTPVVGDGPEAWDMDHIRAVAWVQQGASDGLRFDAHEVVQAVMQTGDDNRATATQKVVLMEMYSATWCDTCLFGDRVAEEMAIQYGVERDLEEEDTGYLREGPWALMVVAGLVAGLAVAWPRLPGGRP